jgi:hypothetical protein
MHGATIKIINSLEFSTRYLLKHTDLYSVGTSYIVLSAEGHFRRFYELEEVKKRK